MVKIMLSSMPPQYQETVRVGQISGDGREHARLQQQGVDVGWGQTLACQEATSYAAECILWCTIALGALVQGCSSTFVSAALFSPISIGVAVVYLPSTYEKLCSTWAACPYTLYISRRDFSIML